jgi:hypothetical protein
MFHQAENQKAEYYTECRKLFFENKLRIGYSSFGPFDFWPHRTLNAKKDQKAEVNPKERA